MLVFLPLLFIGANALTCASNGGSPLLAAYNNQEFPCSKRSVESLVCPIYNACEYLGGSFVCCPYGATSTCNRYAASTEQCTNHTGCVVTKEYGCIEATAATAGGLTTITTLPFITGSCWHRCGVAGWQSRTLGPPNPNTACSCLTTCWQSNNCCVDYPFFCSYIKAQYARYPA